MEFWNSLLTEKSWKILKDLQKKKFSFILIGGWAAYLWTRLHKSKDIDIIVPEFKDLNFLKKEYDLRKNENLRKYEIMYGEIDIDIYVPFYSKLTLDIGEIKRNIAVIENFKVVAPEVLLILKQGAELDRKDSVKGGKDRIDILTLLFYSDIDFEKYKKLLEKYKLKQYLNRLLEIIGDFGDIKYLDLNPREFKLKKAEVIKKLKQ